MNAKKLLATARMPERTVRLCLRSDLVERYESASRDTSASLAGSDVALLDGLRQEMEAATLTITIRALPRPRFRALVDEHQPRQTEDGGIEERDAAIGVNVETFPDALIRACAVGAGLDDDDWRVLLEESITDAQYDLLFGAAWVLNKRSVDIPF